MKNLVFLIFLLLVQTNLLAQEGQVQIANLSKGDTTGWTSLARAFVANDPGYDLSYVPASKALMAGDLPLDIFMQEGERKASTFSNKKCRESGLTVGDIVLLSRSETMQAVSTF